MKVKINATNESGKDALEKALWVKEHPDEALALVRGFKKRFLFRTIQKEYDLKVLCKEPLTVEYDVRRVAQLMAKDPKVNKSIEKMMKDYGAEPGDYEVKI